MIQVARKWRHDQYTASINFAPHGLKAGVRREFEQARQIERRGILSRTIIWHLPQWMYADPGKGLAVHRRRIAPDKWPELPQCIGSSLLHARLRGLMRWEFTGHSGMVSAKRNPSTRATEMKPLFNYWPVQHLCNLSPPNAEGPATGASHPSVSMTAFRARERGHTDYTFPIARLRAVVSGETEHFKQLGSIGVHEGNVRIELPLQSFLTITTKVEK